MENSMIRRISIALSCFAFCALTLLPCDVAAQGAQVDALPSPILTKSKLDKLNKLLGNWYELDLEANELLVQAMNEKNSRKRDKRRKDAAKMRAKARKAKASFQKAFEAEGEKAGDLLRSVPDMLAIFSGCFPYDKQSNGGRAREDNLTKDKADGGYAFRFPQRYNLKKAWPLVYVLPPKRGDGWERRKEFVDQLWPKTAKEAFESTIIVMPRFDDSAKLAAEVDPTEVSDDARKLKIYFLQNLGAMFKRFRIDTDRVYLQAMGDSIPYALRMASLYSDRFAGLILVDPKTSEFDGSTVLTNLTGLGVALIADGDSKQHADAIATSLDAAGVKNVKRIEASGAEGFAAKAVEVHTWMQDVKRDLFRTSFSHTPAADRAWQSYWCQILAAEYLADVRLSDRPMVKVAADRSKNRIEITGRNVSRVRLYLNDLLVDLEKDITLVLNGQVKTVRAQRNLRLLVDPREGLVVKRGDPRYVFTATDSYALPTKADEKKASKDPGGEER